MVRPPLDRRPGIAYGHLVSTTEGVFVTKRQWIIHPLPVERPEQGARVQEIQCVTCGGKLTVRVSSLEGARRRRRIWQVIAASAAVAAVLCVLLAGAAGDNDALRAVLLFGSAITAATAFGVFMRSRMEDGVTVRWPTISRMRGHMLRWPPGTVKNLS